MHLLIRLLDRKRRNLARVGWVVAGLSLVLIFVVGCLPYDQKPQGTFAWGEKGLGDGRLYEPRAIAIDSNNNVFVSDKTGRIQRFSIHGKFICGWRIPKSEQGKPVALGISQDGMLIVSDTHYFRVLFYTPDGKLLEDRTIGGMNGRGPGEFGFVTDVAQDSQGNYFVGEYGGFDRIQKFSPEGKYLGQFGSSGSEDGQFLRPQSFCIDKQDRIWVADSSNHRIQVFDLKQDPVKWLFSWGELGFEPGQLNYPFGITMDQDENLYVVEYGNHRIQKFTQDGKLLGSFGSSGSKPGQFNQPWSVCLDNEGALNVVDRYNHRVQRFYFSGNADMQATRSQ